MLMTIRHLCTAAVCILMAIGCTGSPQSIELTLVDRAEFDLGADDDEPCSSYELAGTDERVSVLDGHGDLLAVASISDGERVRHEEFGGGRTLSCVITVALEVAEADFYELRLPGDYSSISDGYLRMTQEELSGEGWQWTIALRPSPDELLLD